MPKELYYRLNATFAAVRSAEREATQLEQQAAQARDRATNLVNELYVMLNRADTIALNVKDIQPSTNPPSEN
jgi:hypothetical protein